MDTNQKKSENENTKTKINFPEFGKPNSKNGNFDLLNYVSQFVLNTQKN